MANSSSAAQREEEEQQRPFFPLADQSRAQGRRDHQEVDVEAAFLGLLDSAFQTGIAPRAESDHRKNGHRPLRQQAGHRPANPADEQRDQRDRSQRQLDVIAPQREHGQARRAAGRLPSRLHRGLRGSPSSSTRPPPHQACLPAFAHRLCRHWSRFPLLALTAFGTKAVNLHLHRDWPETGLTPPFRLYALKRRGDRNVDDAVTAQTD